MAGESQLHRRFSAQLSLSQNMCLPAGGSPGLGWPTAKMSASSLNVCFCNHSCNISDFDSRQPKRSANTTSCASVEFRMGRFVNQLHHSGSTPAAIAAYWRHDGGSVNTGISLSPSSTRQRLSCTSRFIHHQHTLAVGIHKSTSSRRLS